MSGPLNVDAVAPAQVWELVRDLAALNDQWVLIGGLMVALYDLEYGHDFRETHDVDSLFDVRRGGGGAGLRRFARQVTDTLAFTQLAGHPGVGHRFIRGDLILDVLAADHFPSTPNIEDQPKLVTFQVPGGSQAIDRAEPVSLQGAGVTFTIRRPNLTGAVILKAHASQQGGRDKDHRDLASLITKIRDPRTVRAQLKPGEVKLLAGRLADPRARNALQTHHPDTLTIAELLAL